MKYPLRCFKNNHVISSWSISAMRKWLLMEQGIISIKCNPSLLHQKTFYCHVGDYFLRVNERENSLRSIANVACETWFSKSALAFKTRLGFSTLSGKNIFTMMTKSEMLAIRHKLYINTLNPRKNQHGFQGWNFKRNKCTFLWNVPT